MVEIVVFFKYSTPPPGIPSFFVISDQTEEDKALLSPYVNPLRVSPEVPTDLSLTLCSHLNKVKTHDHMQYFPEPVAHCASIRSSKHRRNRLHDEKQSTSLDSLVSISWRNVAANVQCLVHYKGYQSEYRFSPDFGTYESCQFALSRHIFNLPETPWQVDTPPARLNETDPECPLLALPATYGDYVSCTLKPNTWYILDWHSSIAVQTFHNGSYGTHWANYSTSFVFQPTDRLSLNGTEGDWLRRLLSIETRVTNCETTSALIQIDRHWVPLTSLTVFYRITHHHQKVFSRLLSVEMVDRWLQLDFPLHPHPGLHEICVQLSSSAVPSLRQKLCRAILDQNDCPFSSSSSLLLPLALFLFLFQSTP